MGLPPVRAEREATNAIMQSYNKLELTVGAFVTLGVLALGYLALTLGNLRLGSSDQYVVQAAFSSVGSLKVGDPVKVAGVDVGEVRDIRLADFNALAELGVDNSVKLPKDTIASIQSASLLGDVYVSLSPGAAEDDLAPGDRIQRTEPALSITELISKYAFGSPVAADEESTNAGSADQESPFSDPLE